MSTDIATIKHAAAGRWPEIIPALGGLPLEILDGKHHPCPRCGGVDRFRAFDDFSETGGVYCNQCHAENNSDGISTLQWANGIDFRVAAKLLADHLGIQNGNGRQHRKPKLAESAAKIKSISTSVWDTLLQMYAAAKPPISPEGIKKCGGTIVRWCGHRCIRLDGRAPIDSQAPTAIVLVRASGKPFPAWLPFTV